MIRCIQAADSTRDEDAAAIGAGFTAQGYFEGAGSFSHIFYFSRLCYFWLDIMTNVILFRRDLFFLLDTQNNPAL